MSRPRKRVCLHAPSTDSINARWCKYCAREIKPVSCLKCDGAGVVHHRGELTGGSHSFNCPSCRGSGTKRWRLAK